MKIKRWLLGVCALMVSCTAFAVPVFSLGDDLGHEKFFLDDIAGVSTNSLFEIKLEEAGFVNTNSVGLYRTGSSHTAGTLGLSQHYVQLFDGADGINHVAKLSWNLLTQELSLAKSTDGIFFTSIALGLLSMDSTGFGFYLDNGHGDVFFSENSLNADGVDHMVALQAGAPDSFVLAWEDLAGGGDGDYNDFVMLADDILPVQAVSEPIGLALMFGGLGMLGLVRRRK